MVLQFLFAYAPLYLDFGGKLFFVIPAIILVIFEDVKNTVMKIASIILNSFFN